MSDVRLSQIFEQSSSLFIKQGYERTQIKDIVRATGISTGAIYSLFTSKKAIWKFVLKCTIDEGYINATFEFPIDEAMFINIDNEISEFLENLISDYKRFSSNPMNGSLSEVISYAYDILNKYALGCLVIEKNPTVDICLSNKYKSYRQSFFSIILNAVDVYKEKGVIKNSGNSKLLALFIVESLSWWSMDIWYNSFETYKDIGIAQAKHTCCGMILNGLL